MSGRETSGATLPEFLTPNIAVAPVEKFDIKPIDRVDGDIEAMMTESIVSQV